MRLLILSFFLPLAVLLPANAQRPQACSTEIAASTSVEPMSALRACYNALPSIGLGEPALNKTMKFVDPVTDYADSPESAKLAAKRIFEGLEATNQTKCEQGPLYDEPNTCLLSVPAAGYAAELVSASSITDYGLNYFTLAITSNNMVFGENRQNDEAISLCSYVEQAKPHDLNSPCTMKADDCKEDCRIRLSVALSIMPELRAMLAIANMHSTPTLIQVQKEVRTVKASWINYVHGGEDSEAQHIGEVLLNSYVFRPSLEEAQGLSLPPTQRLVFLKPGLGLEAFESDGTKTEIAGVIEVLGYRRWSSWNEDGTRSGQWGASLIASYSPADDADDWGYGVLVKTPLKSIDISWTMRDSDDGTRHAILFSTDLSKLLPKTPLASVCGILGANGNCLADDD